MLLSLSYPCSPSPSHFPFISSLPCLIPLTLLFAYFYLFIFFFKYPDLSKFPSMPACYLCARGIWRDDQVKMMCFAAFFFFFRLACRGCIILYPHQFRRHSGAHWRQRLTIQGLFHCRLSIKIRGTNTVQANGKVKGERLVLLLTGMSVRGGGGERPLS